MSQKRAVIIGVAAALSVTAAFAIGIRRVAQAVRLRGYV